VSDLAQTLQAGGMVPANAKLGKDAHVDTVVARAYAHPVLPGRTVVRLTAQSVAAGDDLEMATLGFGDGDDRGAVAKERKRPLGFPGWALVHDPKNARFALDVVKEIKKLARKAKSKPGHAKEGLDAIAAKLGKTVPHFLPSFYEEAGRIFIEHGAQTYAAAMFGKARDAEAVHALDVDEQHRVDAFLEFALAGAVTTKALTQYAKDLAEHHEPKVAYAHFRQLCLQRTLGGMPPWSGMAKELSRLAKAAKLDPAAEDATFIVEIIESPALAKAAGEFWRAYAAPLTALGKESAKARGALLNLFPTGTTQSPDLDEAWLELLEATGATAALVGNDFEPEAATSAGRAAWFDKLTQHLARDWRTQHVGAAAFALLRRMAPMLIADGKPIAALGRYNRIDLDLAELALELGVPVALPEHHYLDLSNWAKQAGEPDRGRDPVRVAAHPTLGPFLATVTAGAIGGEPFDTVSAGKQGFLAAKRAWLESVIHLAEQGALVGLEDALVQVNRKVKASTFAELPELYARFAALDLAPALARTLRIGIIDELGWPLLEELVKELNPDGKTELALHGGPPALVLATKVRAVAFGAGGRLGEHDLVIPPKHELATIRFIGGQFLVVLKSGQQARAYWSSAPHEVFDSDKSIWQLPTLVSNAIVLADGAWSESGVPIRPGERNLALGAEIIANDGTTAWTSEWKDGQQRWRERSASGEAGRYSFPSWIEAGLDGDWRLAPGSRLMPAPVGAAPGSPVPMKDGFVGVLIRYQGAHPSAPSKRELETIDGTRWSGPAGVFATALVKWPGTNEPRPLVESVDYSSGTTITILNSEGTIRGSKFASKDRTQARGQTAVWTTEYWTAMTTRDEAGSRRLRAITDDDARALLAAVPVETSPPAGIVHPEPADFTASVIPEVTHPRLKSGLAGIAVRAAALRLERDRLVTERAPANAQRPTSTGPDDTVLVAALFAWGDRTWGNHEGMAWAQIERVGAVLASDDRSDRTLLDLPRSAVDWLPFAVSRGAIAMIAAAIGTPPDQRKALVGLLGHFARHLPAIDKLRVVVAMPLPDLADADSPFTVRWYRGNAYVLRRGGYWQGSSLRVLEYAPSGTFAALPGLSITDETRGVASGPSSDDIATLATAIDAGQTSWSPEAAGRLARATGLTPSEATFLWAGSPNASDHSANFLPKELREQLGLKATQAAIARDGLAAIPVAKRLAALDEAGRAGIAAILDGRAADELAAAWLRRVGKRIAIPEELVEDAGDIHAPMPPSLALAMIGNAADAPKLATDGSFAFDKQGSIIRTAQAEPLVGQTKLATETPVFDASALQTVAVYVPFLYAALPVGDPMRAQAAAAYDLVLARLRNPALWLETGRGYLDTETTAALDRLLTGLGGEIVPGLDEGIELRRFPGCATVKASGRFELKLQPATLDASAAVLAGKLAQQVPLWGIPTWQALALVRSVDFVAFIARIGKTIVPAGGWEQNPLASVPKLVDKVAKVRRLSSEAAALYLQYLVLLWPTAKNIQRWNGWKPKQLEDALGELARHELVLEAKRERAGRGHFLPGGWEALKSPHPPMETWKATFYGGRNAQGDIVLPFQRYQALAPFHLLFERAWQRIEAGDVPRYEEIKR
jgi:hypothetical protein